MAIRTVSIGLLAVGALAASSPATGDAAEVPTASEGRPRDPVARTPGKTSARRKLPSPFGKATPEEQARLTEERKRISAASASTGNDPTAVIGYYQLSYGHNDYAKGLSANVATAVVRLPLTPNWVLQATFPYIWGDLNGPRGFSVDGASDLVLRTGGRLYVSDDVALFAGLDASFPAASERSLGTGKYTLGPGLAVAAPLPRAQTLSYVLLANYHSIGGDPSRAGIHYLQLQAGLNTLWSPHWWTLLIGTWDTDWNNRRRAAFNLVGRVGYRVDQHWNLFVGGGGGLVGQDTFLGLDWNVQAGVRWVFDTPLMPETFLGGPRGPADGS